MTSKMRPTQREEELVSHVSQCKDPAAEIASGEEDERKETSQYSIQLLRAFD